MQINAENEMRQESDQDSSTSSDDSMSDCLANKDFHQENFLFLFRKELDLYKGESEAAESFAHECQASKPELTADSYIKMREANRKYICKFFD